MRNYELIGITGTTGSGKSVVCKIFAENGYTVIDADSLARDAVTNPLVLNLLCKYFGDDILHNGSLDRRLLGERAFSDKEKTAVLNSITHPFISSLFVSEIKELTNSGVSKIIFDAPQLFESGLDILCDCIIAVTADETIREHRITKRDNISPQLAKKRISVQHTTEFFKKNSDFLIENNSSMENLFEKTKHIINKLREVKR